jgi:hypothetical protein
MLSIYLYPVSLILILKDLFEKKRHQERNKIKNGNDDGADAYLVDPFITEISFNPAARFDEMPKALEQAPFRRDFPLHRSGLPYGA